MTKYTYVGAEGPTGKHTPRFYIRRGEPTGAHLLAFSRAGLKRMAAHFAAIHDRSLSHLLGFDTFLRDCPRQVLMRSKRALAYQRTHGMVKRR